ncbi:MAG: cytochrome c [Kiloniellales bacterium]|jgi:cytochrome c556|nr:cytochrome c [Kiloniellales bacterium]
MGRKAARHLLAGTIFAAAVAAAGLSATKAGAQDDPAALIAYRQSIMKAIGGHMGAIAMAAKGDVSFTDEVAFHARAINEMSMHLTRLFPEGSGKEAGETRALPVIWEKWDEFTAAAENLGTESAKLVEVAESGDRAAIAAQTGELGNEGCGGCHKTFREKTD